MKKAKPERETNEIMRHRRVFSWFCVVAFCGCGMDHCLWSFTSCLLLSLYISFPPFYSHNTPNCICFPITRPVTVWIALEKKKDAVFCCAWRYFFRLQIDADYFSGARGQIYLNWMLLVHLNHKSVFHFFFFSVGCSLQFGVDYLIMVVIQLKQTV